MGRRGPRAAALLGVCVLAGGLAGCGSDAAVDPLDVSVDGFVAAADRPTPTTLCEPDPTEPAPPPVALPDGLRSQDAAFLDAAFLESAPTTVEAYLWEAKDADTAQSLVSEATAAASPCTWTVAVNHDLDGDGVAETPSADTEQAGEWSSGTWSGVRVVRVTGGSDEVDRRLVADGKLVLLVVTSADGEDPALLSPADDYLAAVADHLH
jgi:hypothetical protein